MIPTVYPALHLGTSLPNCSHIDCWFHHIFSKTCRSSFWAEQLELYALLHFNYSLSSHWLSIEYRMIVNVLKWDRQHPL